MARLLSPLLRIPEMELLSKFQLRMITNRQGKPVLDRYVVLKKKIPLDEWQIITNALRQADFGIDENGLSRKQKYALTDLRTKAIIGENDQLREYPNQNRASHVLGFVGESERETTRGKAIEMTGASGIEYTLNPQLQGVRGWRQTETTINGKMELVPFRTKDVAPRPGLNVVLTLDLGLQDIIESELAEAMKLHRPISASAVIVRPKTGEILAMATLPNFNPNAPGDSPVEFLRNRLINDESEPGSTFKVVVVTAALNERLVSLQDTFYCENGHFYYAGKPLRDTHPYGLLTVEQIITKSSNIGAAKIGLKMGPALLYHYMRQFGFGSPTGIPLPGERMGTVHAIKKWSKLSITRIPMGQEVATTPLQMAMAMCAIANGGKLMRPMLVSRLEDEQQRVVAQYAPQVIRQVCSEAASRQMITALKTVVGTNGTAIKARLDHYQVAGKTGTAQKADRYSYLAGKYFASFLGFFPADQAELCIAVVLDEPRIEKGYYGGHTAAPVFKNIAERAANYLSLPPEIISPEALAAAHSNPMTNLPSD